LFNDATLVIADFAVHSTHSTNSIKDFQGNS